MQSAITFDFHNTLINCDAWFDLEVSRLPAEVARVLGSRGGALPGSIDPLVLTDTYRALRAEIIDHGNELDATECVLETFRRLGAAASSTEIAGIVDALFRPLVAASVVVDGVKETLEHLRLLGVRIGVVSSAVHHDFLEWTLTHHRLRSHFDVVVTSASSGFYKSRPEIFLAACELLGSNPGQTVHIGDSFRFDHLGGRTAGLRTVWLNGREALPSNQDPAPDLVLETLVGAGPRIHQLLLARSYAD